MKHLLTLTLLIGLLPLVTFAQEVTPDEPVDTASTTTTENPVEAYVTGLPTNVYYYLGGVLAFVIIYFFITKMVRNKDANFKASSFAVIDQKSPAEKQAMLESLFNNDGPFSVFSSLMKEEKIIGIRQCYPFQTMTGAVKQGAKTLGKQALWSLVGVRATYHDVGKYYLVLTDKNLHYIAFDKHDEVSENVLFPIAQLMNITIKNPNTKDMMKYSVSNTSYYAPEGAKSLEFEYDGEKLQFIYCGKNLIFPNMDDASYSQAFRTHYDAMLYVETMFQKKLEEKAGTTFEG